MVLRQIINKGAITMDHIHDDTIEDVRIPGRHLSLEERGMIQALHRQGLSLRTRLKRHNGLLRDFIPKSMSIERFSDEDILDMADTLNQRPRRVLGYHTPSELFDAFLDEVYAIECVS
jgi:IS30 family transposase